MGEFNSSVTRVWPMFDHLFARDPTGASWLGELLRSSSRADRVDASILDEPGTLLPELARLEREIPGQIVRAIRQDRADRIGHIRNAYEADVPPPEAFLRWLLEHPDRLMWPKDGSRVEKVYGAEIQKKRKRLRAGDADVRLEALQLLAQYGAMGSKGAWWAFEGFTSADCRLETESLLVLIEGKRTETVSASINWFPGRNQIVRNLEAARALAGAKNYAVLLCAQTPVELDDEVWAASLPHFASDQVADLKGHYLGCATWADIARRLCPGFELPDTVDDAITNCFGLRS